MITNEQRKARKNGIGASDSAIIMGASSYKSPYELFLEKTGLINIEEKEETERQFWGNELEAVILKRFATLNNVNITTPDTIYHDEHKFIFANLDGFVPEWNACVEVKNVDKYMRKEWDDAFEDGVPAPYLIQLAKQVMLSKADKGYFAVLIGGNEYLQFEYNRDAELEEIILQSDLKFWDCVQRRIEPALVNLNDYKLKFPTSVPDKKIMASSEDWDDIAKYVNIRAEISKLSEIQDKAKMAIMSRMGDADCLTDDQDKNLVTWRSGKRGRTFLVK